MAIDTSSTPSLSHYLKTLRLNAADGAVDHLVLLLRRKQIAGSRACALAAAHLYEQLISGTDIKSVPALLDHVRSIGRRLQAASPQELAIGNVARRVLGLIREAQDSPSDEANADTEGKSARSKADNQSSLLFTGLDGYSGRTDKGVQMDRIIEDVQEGLSLLLTEIREADGQVSDTALDHIHANETVLTYGLSYVVQRFLLRAAKSRKFTVIQVEGFPNEHRSTHETVIKGAHDEEKDAGQRLKSLSAAGMKVIVVPDSAIFAVMPQVSKAFLPIHVGFPNGGFVSAAGSSLVAQAAQAHRVPVLALGAIYRLTPLPSLDIEELVEQGNAGNVTDYKDLTNAIDVINPLTDYIPPDLVSLFVTNIGGHAPSFLYRIIADHYRTEDVDLDDAHGDSANGGR